RRERLPVDVLAAFLEQIADVPEEGHVRVHVLGSPLVHRREGMVRLGAAAVVLEQQVLGHGGDRLLVSWAAPVEALHLVSGADQRFSTWNHSFGALTGRTVCGARREVESADILAATWTATH